MGRRALSAVLSLSMLSAGMVDIACARDRVWLIGGGYDLENSEVQIEQNVLWAREVLAQLPGTRELAIFFTDGDDPAPDITQWQRPADVADVLQPLARVFDSHYLNGESVRNHQIDGVRGPASRASVTAALRADLAALAPGERGLLVYAGHGSPDGVLNLWGDTELDVADLTGVLAAQPADTRLRLLFTQCYAGSFHAAVMAAPADEPSPGMRCGFYAVPADKPAEGCTASLEVADYRGYSTYFFAALAGHARDGTDLPVDPDRDRNGRVDPFEAHLYTLRAARSTDLPRASSEQYLLDWAPWYLPLIPVTAIDDNPYRGIAAGLAGDLGIDGGAGRGALLDHRKQVQQQIRRLIYRQEQARARATGAAQQLRYAVESRWPRVRYPYTAAFKAFLEQDLAAAQTFIQTQPLYADLMADQDQWWVLDRAVLELQRRLAQLDRIQQLQHLARVRDAFQAWAGQAERDRYRGLLECERAPL